MRNWLSDVLFYQGMLLLNSFLIDVWLVYFSCSIFLPYSVQSSTWSQYRIHWLYHQTVYFIVQNLLFWLSGINFPGCISGSTFSYSSAPTPTLDSVLCLWKVILWTHFILDTQGDTTLLNSSIWDFWKLLHK